LDLEKWLVGEMKLKLKQCLWSEILWKLVVRSEMQEVEHLTLLERRRRGARREVSRIGVDK